MALSNDQVVDKLNHVLGTLRDGEKGYREAADEASSSDYTTMFNEYAQQRSRFAAEITSEIRRLGGEPRDHSSAAAALHRTWLNVRDTITGKGDEAVIAEVERGEDVTIDNYQDVMDDDLPSNVKTMLSQQYQEVKAAHDRISNIKHAS